LCLRIAKGQEICLTCLKFILARTLQEILWEKYYDSEEGDKLPYQKLIFANDFNLLARQLTEVHCMAFMIHQKL
jgi:hypothetical protein